MAIMPGTLRAGDVVTHDNWPGNFVVSVLPAVRDWDPNHPGVMVAQQETDEGEWYAYYSFLHLAHPKRLQLPQGI